ncbi:MAG TPA: tetratricopeptide repeat protein [Phycisphaerae bacterium]|nr:tetratricopeptide repeat protein [Phycisphaerae bacterium]
MASIPSNPDGVLNPANRPGNRGVVAAAIAAACLFVTVAHWPVLSANALFIDDGIFIFDNPLVLSPSWESARRFFAELLQPSTVMGYSMPLSMISLMVDVGMGGSAENLLPFHRASLLLHLISTALVILILHRLFKRPLIAAAVGVLFGVHPLTVEPVAWLSDRKTILCAMFTLASMWTYLRHVARPGWSNYSASIAFFVMASLSKPSSLTLPVVLLLIDWWPLGRRSRRVVWEKAPYFIVAAAFVAITLISQIPTAEVGLLDDGPRFRVPLVLCHNIVYYLYEIVWPRHLRPLYLSPEPLDLSHPMIRAGVIGTAILIPFLLISLRWTRALLAGWLIFFVALFPSSGVFRVSDSIAWDRYLYLPSIGLLMIVAWVLTRAADALRGRRSPQIILAAVVLVLIGLEIVGTRRQLDVWQDSETLVRYTLSLEPRSSVLHNRLGAMLEEAGRADEAFAEYQEAVRQTPNNPQAQNSLAQALSARGRDAEAIEHYKTALRVKYVPYDVHYNYALLLARQGRPQEAIAQLRASLAMRPDFINSRVHLANLLADTGQFAEAVEHYRLALAARPDSANLHNNLGSALRNLGRVDEAIEEFETALDIDANYVSSIINHANALRQQGRLESAIARYREALAVDPSQGAAHFNLGTALLEQRKFAEAVSALLEAMRLLPTNAEVRYQLGCAIEAQGRPIDAFRQYREALRLDPNHAGAKSKLSRN